VPDKFFICKQNDDSPLPKALYTNRKMKEFLGGDPSISHRKRLVLAKQIFKPSSQQSESSEISIEA
jgi:hypothetical protein